MVKLPTFIYPHPTTRVSILLLLFLGLMISIVSTGQAGVAENIQLPPPPGSDYFTNWNQVEFIIVTTTELHPEFVRLADWRSQHGMSATVVTVDWIVDVAPAGMDLQETIRNFLALAYDQWQTRYLLLGGDWEQLPSRVVRSRINPEPGMDYTDFPSDWYFGCLDGTWDADGDGLYGEIGPEGDEPDLAPELAVGRAPVGSPQDAMVFVDKVIGHDMAMGEDYLHQALLLGEVINPVQWQPGDQVLIDGAQYLEFLFPIFDGAHPVCQASRLYENHSAFPGASPLNRQVVMDTLSSGNFNLVYHLGSGDGFALSLGGFPETEFLAVADVPDLVNAPNYFTIMSLSGLTACGASPTLFEKLICSPDGGAVAAFGKTSLAYVFSSREMGEVVLEHLLAFENTRLGDAHKHTLADFGPQASTNSLWHLAVLETTLMGDPTMVFRPETAASVVGTMPPVSTRVAMGDCSPNPFNPCTTIHFEVFGSAGAQYGTTLEIFDLNGQRIKTLLNECLAVGPHEKIWNGVDDGGRTVGSGVYFAVVNVADHSDVKKVVLLK